MNHYGTLRDYRFDNDVEDVRNAELYGAGGEKLGVIDDVVFDHSTGAVRYAVVDTGGWLTSKKFVVPAERIHPDPQNADDFRIDLTREQIQRLPEYDEAALESEEKWQNYEDRYEAAWTEAPVQHREGSTHNITPEPDEMASTGLSSGMSGGAAGVSSGSMRETASPSGAHTSHSYSEGLDRNVTPGRGEYITATNPAGNVHGAGVDHTTRHGRARGATSWSSPRWSAFDEQVRQRRSQVSSGCRICGSDSLRKTG